VRHVGGTGIRVVVTVWESGRVRAGGDGLVGSIDDGLLHPTSEDGHGGDRGHVGEGGEAGEIKGRG
jgi:hypothetical protein